VRPLDGLGEVLDASDSRAVGFDPPRHDHARDPPMLFDRF
jgi:hypothetical protein